jgi:hypothetical protein
MTVMKEARIVIDIPGATGTAKGAQSQAYCEQTITGLRWTLTGELAKALSAFLETKPDGR